MAHGDGDERMKKAERQARIRDMIDQRESVSVRDIALALDVSGMTIRRDLEEMAEAGELVRVHGGARRVTVREPLILRREYTQAEKRSRNLSAKRTIAKRAVSLIKPDSTVFLGVGTTVEQIVPLLPDSQLRIVTNSLSVFNMIEAKPGFDLCLIGGMYRPGTAAFVGPIAEKALEDFGFDSAFIGANAIFGDSVFTANVDEGHLQEMVLNKANTRCVVADASKFGRRDFMTFYHMSELDYLITDASIPADERTALEERTHVLIS